MNEETKDILRRVARALYGDELANDDGFLERARQDLVDYFRRDMVSIPSLERLLCCEVSAQKISEGFREIYPGGVFEDDFQLRAARYTPGSAYVKSRIPFPDREISREICNKVLGFIPSGSQAILDSQTDGNLEFSVQYRDVFVPIDDAPLGNELEDCIDSVFQLRLREAYTNAADFWDKHDPLASYKMSIPLGFYEFLQGVALSYLKLVFLRSEPDKDSSPGFSATVTNTETVFKILTSRFYGFRVDGDDLLEIKKSTPRVFSVKIEPSDDTDRFYITIIIPRTQPTD